jgi:putative SOS response-associated peptidase YedK
MCGRFSLAKSKEELQKRFAVQIKTPIVPQYNIAPMQSCAVITNQSPNELQFFQWGLIPSWSIDRSTALNMINARAESVYQKIPFKHIVKNQRCLVPSDGFFEWRKEGKNKVPYRFNLNSDDTFAYAGLWDSWKNEETGDILNSFTIITTDANKVVKAVHDRMPVILRKDLEKLWIAEDVTESQATSLLKPYDTELMYSYAVHRAVNDARNNTPECIQAAPRFYPGETMSLFD